MQLDDHQPQFLYETILCRTKTIGQRSFSYSAPKQWNSLPSDIRHIQSAHVFKTALKTHLFKQYYENWFQILSSFFPNPQLILLFPVLYSFITGETIVEYQDT